MYVCQAAGRYEKYTRHQEKRRFSSWFGLYYYVNEESAWQCMAHDGDVEYDVFRCDEVTE